MQLICGDCLEWLGTLPAGSVDLVLADIPYGIDFQSNRRKDKDARLPKILNDKQPFTSCISHFKPLLKPSGGVLLFTRWDVQKPLTDEMTANSMPVKSVIVWDKVVHGMGDLKRAYGSRYESILWAPMREFRFPGKRPTDIIRCMRVPAGRMLHPNEKPVELLETLIEQTTIPGATVLDFCMGSGSTGVACVKTGRRFIGIELDERYFSIAKRRISETQNVLDGKKEAGEMT